MKKIFLIITIGFSLYACSGGNDDSLLKSKCLSCHNMVPICAKIGIKNVQGWIDSIDAMKKAGAKISNNEKERLANFLAGLKQEKADFCK